MNPWLLFAGGGSIVCAAVAVLLLRTVEAQERFATRIAVIHRVEDTHRTTATSPSSLFVRVISAIGITIARSGALSDKTLAELQQTLSMAGFKSGSGLGIFVGSKILLLVSLPLVCWIGLIRLGATPILHNAGTLACAVIGLLGPDFVIKRARARYLTRLASGLPDALDMMVICSEAGLGLEPSISRVAVEISHTHPVVSTELLQTASELRVISDRRLALQNMGTRTGLDGLKRLGATLIQTTQYGTPVSNALRALSNEMRADMLTQFEERAARLPVLLTVPMIVFILPTVFAVVGGPAMLRVASLLHH